MSITQEVKTELMDWLRDSYDINTAALADLGFSEAQIETTFPSLSTVKQAITPAETDFISDRLSGGSPGELVITPLVQLIGLTASQGLITRFDLLQSKPSFVEQISWSRTLNRHQLHDNKRGWPNFQVGILLGDTSADKLEQEPGLYSRGAVVDQQRLFFQEQRQAFANRGLVVDLATIAQFVMVSAQRRIKGESLLDSLGTVTRFIQYPDEPETMGRPPYTINTAFFRGGRLFLKGSITTQAKENEGIRESLRLNVIKPEEPKVPRKLSPI